MKEQKLFEHLSAYLPYDVILWFNKDLDLADCCDNEYDKHTLILKPYNLNLALKSECRPLLHPLSKLTEEIEHNGEKFVPFDKYNEIFGINDDYLFEVLNDDGGIDIEDIKNLPYYVVNWLISLHFDVFDLLRNSLAIEK